MRKKLLAILLPMFMMLGCFVNVVHAEKTTVDDILPAYFPRSFNQDPWVNEDGSVLFLDILESDAFIYFNNEQDFVTVESWEPVTEIDLTEIEDNKYSGSCIIYDYGENEKTDHSMTLTFNFSSDEYFGKKLVSVDASFEGDGYSLLNGKYQPTAEAKVADILPRDFFEENWYWINENGFEMIMYDYYYPKYNFMLLKDGYSVLTQAIDEMTFINRNQVLVEFEDDPFLMTFNFVNNVLDNITISSCEDRDEDFNGTYKVPVFISSVLPDDFPTSLENGWKQQGNDEVSIFIDTNENGLRFAYDGVPADVGYSLELQLDNEFKYAWPMSDVVIQFIIEDNFLTSIITSGYPDQYEVFNGTYCPPPGIKINDLLQTVDSGFPTSIDKGWQGVIQNGDTGFTLSLYNDNGNLVMGVPGEILPICSIGKTLIQEGEAPIYVAIFESGPFEAVGFLLDEKNELGSIIVIFDLQEIEFAPPITIQDILPEDFPVFEDEIPSNAWTNENKSQLMISAGKLCLTGQNSDYPFSDDIATTILTKGTNEYSYTNSDGVIVTFAMTNDGLASIKVQNCTFAELNGIYTAPLTIADILPADFPNIEWDENGIGVPEDVWFNIDKNTYSYNIFDFDGNDNSLGFYKDAENIILTLEYDSEIYLNKDSDSLYFAENIGLYDFWQENVDDLVDIKLHLIDNILASIEVRFYGNNDYESTFGGTYVPSVKIEDIMPDDFPSKTDVFWVNENCDYIYYDSCLYFTSYFDNTPEFKPKRAILNKDNNYESNLEIEATDEKYKAEFVMNRDKFDSVVISGFEGNKAVHNGTFKPAISLSSIMTNSLPTQSETHWTSGNNELFIDDDNHLYFKNSDDEAYGYFFTLDNLSLLKDNDSNSKYYCTDAIDDNNKIDKNMYLTFNMDGTILKSIDATFEGDYSSLNGTYVAPVTIADVLATVSGGFPTTSSSGWVSQDGSKIYSDEDNLNFGDLMPLSSALTPSGNDYEIIKDDNTFTFVMESGVLSKIKMLPSLGSLVSYYPYAYTNPSISKPVGYTGDIEFVTNGKYVDQSTTPVTVSVDDIALDYDIDYEVTTGSTHVKLKGSFVSTLPVGTHTLKTSMDGYDDITTQFTITAAPSPDPTPRYKVPNTGVEGTYSNNHSLLKLSSLSLLVIGTYMVIKKKKDN